jgi:nucleolar protein 16
MPTVRKRRTIKTPSRKVTRKTANKHKRKVNVIGNKIIRENWDKKATLRQKYVSLPFLFCFTSQGS